MYYDEQQGVAYAVSKLYDLLDEYAKDDKIPKNVVRGLIEELENEYK